MTATVTAAHLRDTVAWALRAIPRRPALPVLAAIRLTVEDQTLIAEAFDYETAATGHTSATGRLEQILVHGQVLADVTRQLDGDVTLALDGPRLVIRAGRKTYRLATMPADNAPALPKLPALVGDIDAEPLAAAVTDVACATAHADTGKPELCNIHLRADGDTLTLVATDRYRAHQATVAWHGDPFTALVDGDRLATITKHLAGSTEIGADATSLSVNDGTRLASIVQNAAEYPPLERFFAPRDGGITVDRDELRAAVNAVAVLAENKKPIVLTWGAGELTVTNTSGGDHAADDVITADTGNETGTVQLNPAFLGDTLAALAPGDVLVQAAASVRFANPDDPTRAHVVMSVRNV